MLRNGYSFRRRLRLRLTELTFAATLCAATVTTAQPSAQFTRTGNMTTARSEHAATLLPDGTVLVTGGAQGNSVVLASAEIYNPTLGTFTRTGSMTTARRMHTSTLLPDGRVLTVGGYTQQAGAIQTAVASAELYDPTTGTFAATGSLRTARGGHSAILLPDGKVLIVGGYGERAFPTVAPAELYDPITGVFTAAGAYVGHDGCDFCAPSILLVDGTVLFPQQYPTQIYNPTTDTFVVSGMMLSDHSAATLLADGHVLFAGGEGLGRISAAELYDPTAGTFAATGSMAAPRVWHTLTTLPNGLVLTAGGETDSCSGNFCSFAGTVATAELYDPSMGGFHSAGNMTVPRETHTATLLADGRVLLTGGDAYAGIGMYEGPVGSAEIYTPDVRVPSPTLVSRARNGSGLGLIMHRGTRHPASPDDPAVAGEDLDLFVTGLNRFAGIPPLVAIGGRAAPVLSFDPETSQSGLWTVTVRVPTGVSPGPAVPVRLTFMGRPSTAVTIAVRSVR